MTRTTAIALLLAATAASAAQAQDFNWRGRISRGEAIEIKGVNGAIHATSSNSTEVRVLATKSARNDDPDEVEIEVVEHRGGITVCAVYPTRRNREPNSCEPGSGGRMNVQDNDVQVDFEVFVPAGVELIARTVNGGVTIEALESDVTANTVNGSIELETTGIARAKTVNGSISAAIGSSNRDGDLEFETVNGRIVLEIADRIDADVNAATVNGDISTDFPLTVRGRFGPRRVSGTIGNGGRALSLNTVNGSIEIRRR
jgi:DUF4097 and DUF4098 domain-containing protein YvlB